jgi:hypothetical protein
LRQLRATILDNFLEARWRNMERVVRLLIGRIVGIEETACDT